MNDIEFINNLIKIKEKVSNGEEVKCPYCNEGVFLKKGNTYYCDKCGDKIISD